MNEVNLKPLPIRSNLNEYTKQFEPFEAAEWILNAKFTKIAAFSAC